MMYDLQKASMGKRISAALFDFILLATLAVAIAFLISVIVGYDNHTEKLEELQAQYEQAYGVDFDIKQEEYNKLSDEHKLLVINYDKLEACLQVIGLSLEE